MTRTHNIKLEQALCLLTLLAAAYVAAYVHTATATLKHSFHTSQNYRFFHNNNNIMKNKALGFIASFIACFLLVFGALLTELSGGRAACQHASMIRDALIWPLYTCLVSTRSSSVPSVQSTISSVVPGKLVCFR